MKRLIALLLALLLLPISAIGQEETGAADAAADRAAAALADALTAALQQEHIAVRFRPDEAEGPAAPQASAPDRGVHCLLRSYETDNQFIENAAFTYDNALAAMALLCAGYRKAAEHILDSFAFAVENDRYQPGRIRNAYAAGNIASWFNGESSVNLSGWYDAKISQWCEDRNQVGCNVGNTAWAALALLQYDRLYGSARYLNTAAALMDWVMAECGGNAPGFTAGLDGWPENGPDVTYPFTYKSTEHNIDAYAAFLRLYERTGEERYRQAAESALALIGSLYDTGKGLLCTGTQDDGVTPSTENVVLDTQVWACLALGKEFAPYQDALNTVAAMETAEGGYPFCLSNVNGGWWAEGTAFTALMYRLLGQEDRAASALAALTGIQLESGLFPAATVENLSTGMYLYDGSPWEYGTSPHIAPTAWFVMAVKGFNPYDFD